MEPRQLLLQLNILYELFTASLQHNHLAANAPQRIGQHQTGDASAHDQQITLKLLIGGQAVQIDQGHLDKLGSA